MTDKTAVRTDTPLQRKIEKQRRRYYLKMNLRSLYACFRLGRDPYGGLRFVFMMGDSQDNIAESERRLDRIPDPYRSNPALEDMWQTGFRAPKYDIEALAKLPAETLGGAYARHMISNHLQADFYDDAPPRHRMHYLRLRIRQTHDIWHVLTGLGTDEFDEVALQAFYSGQFPNSTGAIIAVAAFLKSILRGHFDELGKHVESFAEGYCAGKRSGSLIAVKWEELWTEKLDALRARYGIVLPRKRQAAPVRELRAVA
jgi:ubiquinone biosynthesis protein COQ4